MTFTLQKAIDRVIGKMLVGTMVVWRRCLNVVSSRPLLSPINPRLIVVTKYLGLGSMVHLIPLLRSIKQKNPEAQLIVITSPGNVAFLKTHDFLDAIELDVKPGFGMLQSLARVLWYFYRRHVDILYDAEFLTNFSAIVAQFIRCRHRVGFRSVHNSQRNIIFDRVVALDETVHVSQQFLRLVTEDRLCHSISKQTPAVNDVCIGINLNASGMAAERRWPISHFADFIIRLANAYPDAHFILTGLPNERHYSTQFLGLIPACVRPRFDDQTGKTSMEELIAVISRMRLMISVDSGPLALAAYYGVPTISFWGPETPRRYGPEIMNKNIHLTLSINVACSPCLTEANYKTPPCKGKNICMQNMSSKWAWQHSQAFLDSLNLQAGATERITG